MVMIMEQQGNRWTRKRARKKVEKLEQQAEQKVKERVDDTAVTADAEKNAHYLVKLLGDSADVISRVFTIQYAPDRKAAVLYIDGLVNMAIVDQFILHPLMVEGERLKVKTDLWQMVNESLVQTGEMKQSTKMQEIVNGLLSGDTILFVDGSDTGLIIGTRGWEKRGVSEPRAEAVIRGPREGLTETIRINTSMIRRRLKDPDLRLKNYMVGKRTKTNVSLFYIEGVADPKVVQEVEKRIQNIQIDGVLESGYIEELIQDQIWTPFPQLQNTERPDAVVGHLLEGKVAILVDGTPNTLIAPAVFTQFYYSPEDYYERYLITSFLRMIRLLSLFIAMLLPALYIAFVSFHPEMIPSKLAIAMAAGRATVPFPSIVEALIMETSVEVLREASIRLPGPIGPTIGIVGALVIGDAAVSAGLVSPAMVIIVGLTTISSYANPYYNAAISLRLIRFPLMIVAATLGLYGITLALMLILLHLVQLKSFGVPYLAPFSPVNWTDMKDTLIRVPWQWMKDRPKLMKPGDTQRQEEGGNTT
ncbi:spore germination protein [Polycladomyces abyssicola]|uniref:Spore germination protein n=2 Tax=Polycladomyces abyssicola TaxID=1125966 RepID=A0A8D5UFK2_9BACL|nr:spore germination protein [Polycladomyces abyssicola]